MIRFRKLLLLGLLSCFILLGNSYTNAVGICSETTEIYLANIHAIGGTFTSPNDNSLNIGILSNGTVFSQSLGYGRKILAPISTNLFRRGSDGLPYMYYDDGYQGVPYYYHICDEITENTPAGNNINCTTQVYDTGARIMVANLLSKIDNNDFWGYYLETNYYYRNYNICFSSHEIGKSVCFKGYTCSYNSTCSNWNCPLVNTKNYQGLTFTNLSDSDIGDSPGVGGSSGGGSSTGFDGQVGLSNDDIISYYESQYGFNYNMCFVGTWDFEQEDGTFKQGNGEHIFSYFNWFYGLGTGLNATGYSLSDVGKFIDEMYGNYDIYFNYGNRYANGDIAYIYKFYLDTHILDWVETGYNNPFEENSYVYTFYPKILHYYTDYWRLYYYGEQLANYCYYKLNFNNSSQEEIYGNLENNISQGQINNIKDWVVIQDNTNTVINSGTGNNIIVSEDWHGSPIDYFASQNSSGYENFDATTFFTDSFNRFKGVFGELNPGDFGFGYLPSYIIGFMLALILFRFLSH